MQTHNIICLHTMVGYLSSTHNMFMENGYGGTESHFGVGGKWGGDKDKGLDGTVYQWQDLDYQADANLEGNPYIVSIETADNCPKYAKDIESWTDKQVNAIVALVAWLCKKYNIPAVLVPDSKPGRRGIAYHRQGIDDWRVSGGDVWSESRGKECPGDRRISQITSTIIPRVQAELEGDPNDMADITDAQMNQIADKTVAKVIPALLNEQTEVYLDKDMDGKRDMQSLRQQWAGASSDSYTAMRILQDLSTAQKETNKKLDKLIELLSAKEN
jgi:hypothetical protein